MCEFKVLLFEVVEESDAHQGDPEGIRIDEEVQVDRTDKLDKLLLLERVA